MMQQIDLVDWLNPEKKEKRMIREMPEEDQPDYRLQLVGARAMANAELLAVIMRLPDGLDRAQQLLNKHQHISRLANIPIGQLQRETTHKAALAIAAALELGRRLQMNQPEALPKIASPADAANLLMPDMQNLEQEHLVVLPLSTRNDVIATVTIYKGSINTSVVRIAEIFKPAIQLNAAAIIVAHNHPSGDPSPSPEDVQVTRQVVQVGELIDIDVLDHIIIGRQRYVSLKERGLGFDG
jgi:DNA repair protein RadC